MSAAASRGERTGTPKQARAGRIDRKNAQNYKNWAIRGANDGSRPIKPGESHKNRLRESREADFARIVITGSQVDRILAMEALS